MSINLLDQSTINKIAAGEVVDRPSSVVKELVENAIDAHASAITVEIKEGGISFIRITDNGDGIEKDDVKTAFLRHSTSKIKSATDLVNITSLGFRGEALSSISAVSQVELITKTRDALCGIRYVIDGGVEKSFEPTGAPDGTTFIVRNLFYNTPARRKFLKTATTEAGYISSLMLNLSLSHPDISFRFINNGSPKIQTMGNNRLKDIIYSVYGREIASNLINADSIFNNFSINGYIGKPLISRGNRNFETYFINGRYIKSNIISKAIEDAYAPFIMQHKYPFTVLHITIDPGLLDVNVHPSKMELRFSDETGIYEGVKACVYDALNHRELIPDISQAVNYGISQAVNYGISQKPSVLSEKMPEPFEEKRMQVFEETYTKAIDKEFSQMELFPKKELLCEENKKDIRIIGQVFDTYWIMEFEGNMYIVDQHAAHEKVLYEKFMKNYLNKSIVTQQINPPEILTLTIQEQELFQKNEEYIAGFGYEIEEFGEREYAIRAVPMDFSNVSPKELLIEIIDSLKDDYVKSTPESIKDRIATMSCKAAVKGNNHLSFKETEALLNELMGLENPYNCPHGRPTLIMMSKYELEKKFKRIV